MKKNPSLNTYRDLEAWWFNPPSGGGDINLSNPLGGAWDFLGEHRGSIPWKRVAASLTAIFFLWALICPLGFAEVVHLDGGSVDVQVQDKVTNWNVTGNPVWNVPEFNIAEGATHNITGLSQGASLAVLVNGGNGSNIFGTMNLSNLDFVLQNVYGIHIGNTGLVNVNNASFIASTLPLNLNVTDFLSHAYKFEGEGGFLKNDGRIVGHDATLVAMVGNAIENTGTIEVPAGTVVLAAGNTVAVGISGDGMVTIGVDESTANTMGLTDQIKNTGKIESNGGRVVLDAKAIDGLFEKAINLASEPNATSAVVAADGTIEFVSKGNIVNQGTLEAPRGSIEIHTEGNVENPGTLLADRLHEQGNTFRTTGFLGVRDAYFDNIDLAADLSGTIAGGTYTDVNFNFVGLTNISSAATFNASNNITINAGVTVNLGGDTLFNSDSDLSGAGAFTMSSNSTVAGGYAVSILASQNSAIGAISNTSSVTFNKSLSSSTPAFSMLNNISTTGALTVTGGTLQQGTNTITAGALSQSDGMFTGGSGDITVSGNVTLSGGTFTSTSGNLFVGGDWSDTGSTFVHNSGTIDFTKATGTQNFTPGYTAFYNLTHSGSGTLQVNASSWGYRRAITIDHTQVPGDLTDFPLLISASGLGDIIKANGTDIRFTDANGNPLAREIEAYSGGTLVAWAKANLSSSADTIIYMYYGNASATEPAANSTYGSQNVWNSGYKGVWNFGEGSGTTASDSTVNGNTGTLFGTPTWTTGKIDGALSFGGSGSGDYVNAGHSTSLMLSQYTVSAWVKSGTDSQVNFAGIINKYDGNTNANYTLDVSGNTVRINHNASGSWPSVNGTLPLDTWNYVVGTYDGTQIVLYQNGVQVGSIAAGAPATSSSVDVLIGLQNPQQTDRLFNGLIDDVRISNSARSANWITAEYNNQNTPTTFAAMGTPGTGALMVNGTLTNSSGTFSGGSGSMTAGGNVNISGGTFTSTSGNFSVGGNWSNAGTFDSNNGTVTFNAANAGHTINAGTSHFNNIVFNDSAASGAWTIQTNALNVDGSFTMTDGAVTQNTALTVTGAYSQTGGEFTQNAAFSSGSFSQTNGTFSGDYNQTFTVGGSFSVPTSSSGAFNRYEINGGFKMIRDIYDLQAMKSDLDANYKLNNDIDATYTKPTAQSGHNWNAGSGFEPIGDSTNPFVGNINGQNHTITGLYINRSSTDNVGLIGYFSNNLTVNTISNVGMVAGTTIGHWSVGSIAGFVNGGETVSQCYNTGTVTGTAWVGGLVGTDYGVVTDSYNTGTVSGATYVGGIVGSLGFHSSIANSYNTGAVSGTTDVGGVVGRIKQDTLPAPTVTNSYNTGLVTGTTNVGGVAGSNTTGGGGTISNSGWWTGSASAAVGTGGTVTYNQSNKKDFYGSSLGIYSSWDFATTPVWDAFASTYPHLHYENYTPSGVSTLSGNISGLGAGVSVGLSLNGGGYVTTTTTGSGDFTFSKVGAIANDTLLIFANNASYKADLVGVVQDTNPISNVTLQNGRFAIGDTDANIGSSFTNTSLSNAYYNNSNVHYSISSGNATFSDSINLWLPSGMTYTPGGNVSVSGDWISAGNFDGGSGTLDLTGSLSLTGGVFTSTSGIFSVGGDWSRTAGTFSSNSGTVTMTATSGTKTITSGSQSFNNLTINGSGAMFQLGDALDVNGVFHLQAGTFNANAKNQNIAGNFQLDAGTTFTKGGTLTFDGTGSLTDSTVGLQNLGAVEVDAGSYMGSNLHVDSMTIGISGMLAMGSTGCVLEVSGTGTPLVVTGTLSVGTNSKVKYTGQGATNIAATTYHDLEVNDAGSNATYSLQNTTNVAGSLYVTGGTIALSNKTLNVTENVTNDDTITISTGTLDVDGNLDVGTLTSAGASTINLAGNWSGVDTFTPASSTVTLNGTNQTVYGDNAFNHLTKIVGAADTLTFEAGKTQTVNGTLTLKGAVSNLLSLVSGNPGVQWNFNAAAVDMEYLNISDSDNLGTAINLTGKNCVNGGGNTGIQFSAAPAPSPSPASPEGQKAVDQTFNDLVPVNPFSGGSPGTVTQPSGGGTPSDSIIPTEDVLIQDLQNSLTGEGSLPPDAPNSATGNQETSGSPTDQQPTVVDGGTSTGEEVSAPSSEQDTEDETEETTVPSTDNETGSENTETTTPSSDETPTAGNGEVSNPSTDNETGSGNTETTTPSSNETPTAANGEVSNPSTDNETGSGNTETTTPSSNETPAAGNGEVSNPSTDNETGSGNVQGTVPTSGDNISSGDEQANGHVRNEESAGGNGEMSHPSVGNESGSEDGGRSADLIRHGVVAGHEEGSVSSVKNIRHFRKGEDFGSSWKGVDRAVHIAELSAGEAFKRCFSPKGAQDLATEVFVSDGKVMVRDNLDQMSFVERGEVVKVDFQDPKVQWNKISGDLPHENMAAEEAVAPVVPLQEKKALFATLRNPGLDVFVTSKEGKPVPAYDGMVIRAGDEVKTLAKGGVKVVLDDGKVGYVDVRKGSLFRIVAMKENPATGRRVTSLELAIGEIQLKVKKLKNNSQFEIKTPTATASVRGTVFVVRVDRKA